MPYLFTSESVSEGHPDKVADQISDAILDHYLAGDVDSKVACETLVTTGLTVLSGEITSKAMIDERQIARDVIEEIGYTKSEYKFDAESCGIISALHGQSPDILQGVEENAGLHAEQGAGDQGMMFGYACEETETYMPLALELSHMLLRELAAIRKAGKEMTYLRPDAKAQVTIKYDDNNMPMAIDTIVLSTQHDDFVQDKGSKAANDDAMLAVIKADIINILMPRVIAQLKQSTQALFNDKITYHINPTGTFVIGGPHGDTGLTGRKIIVDTYGGKGAHGGGAFSGKDPSKVDRSAAYATRHIAKNMVAAGVAREMLVQVSYAIGVAKPMGIYVNTYGTAKVNMSDGEIAERIEQLFDMRPAAIIERLKLKQPIYRYSAAYGHMGRKSETVERSFQLIGEASARKVQVETFTWEKLDFVDAIKGAFNL